MNFSNNSIGSLPNGVYGLNLLPWPSKPCILVVRLAHWSSAISLLPLAISRTYEISALIQIQFSLAFGPLSQPILWISCFSIFCSQSLEFTICQHPHISVTSYFQTSSKDILLSVSLPHFSCPPCLEYLCPRDLILLRFWRYINHVLTYLLTYLLTRNNSYRLATGNKTWFTN